MSWTINENSKTSVTEYFNATATDMSAGAVGTPDYEDSDPQNVAGYVSGTINFTISPAPNIGGGLAWAAGSAVVISIIGRISGFPALTLDFEVLPTLEIKKGDINSTFSIEWDIPLEDVALRINNGVGPPTIIAPFPGAFTNQTITISSINMQTESQGGGVGHAAATSLGPFASPVDPPKSLQYNGGGVFASTSTIVTYDKPPVPPAPPLDGQLKLPSSSAGAPILVFSNDALPPSYNTGIYGVANDAVGFSAGGAQIVGVYGTDVGVFFQGLNVGVDGTIPADIKCGIRRLSNNVDNSWEEGWMGNSAQLVFTGSDFTNYNTTAAGAPELFAVASARSAGGTGFIMEQAAGAGDNQIIALKLLPKGFWIPENAVVRVTTADQTPMPDVWGSSVVGSAPTIQLLTQNINLPQAIGIQLAAPAVVPMNSWSAAGINTNYITTLASAVGTGTITLVVKITIAAGIEIDFQTSLLGVIVPIERQ